MRWPFRQRPSGPPAAASSGAELIDLSATTVTISMRALDALRRQVAYLEAELAKRATTSGPPPDVYAALRNACEVVSFAVGNLHPNDHPRWPTRPLLAFADECERANLGEWANCYRAFAEKVAEYERYRVRQREARERGQPDPPPPGI